MTVSTYLPLAPIAGRLVRLYRRGTTPIIRLGHLLVFFVRALAAVPIAASIPRRVSAAAVEHHLG